MGKKTTTRLSFFTFAVVFIFGLAGQTTAEEITNLHDLQKSFFTSKEKLLYGYLESLVKLETKILTGNNPKEANEVKAEIRRVETEIKNIPLLDQASGSTPQAAAAAAPPPKPVIKNRTPKTHVSEAEGLAGAPGFSKNNIYTFTLPDIGTKSTLKIWATGHRSVDSTGYVWLITPAGFREKITKWKERYFDAPATEVSSYKKMEPLVEDISEYVTKPGTYQVEFEWTGGIDPLVIFRVELTS